MRGVARSVHLVDILKRRHFVCVNVCVRVCVCVCVCGKGTLYTDTDIPKEFRPQGFEPIWCSDFHLLLSLRSYLTCVCV